MLFDIRRGESITGALVNSNVECFEALLKKSMYNFYIRIMTSSNVLIYTIVSSVFFVYASRLLSVWSTALCT